MLISSLKTTPAVRSEARTLAYQIQAETAATWANWLDNREFDSSSKSRSTEVTDSRPISNGHVHRVADGLHAKTRVEVTEDAQNISRVIQASRNLEHEHTSSSLGWSTVTRAAKNARIDWYSRFISPRSCEFLASTTG